MMGMVYKGNEGGWDAEPTKWTVRFGPAPFIRESVRVLLGAPEILLVHLTII